MSEICKLCSKQNEQMNDYNSQPRGKQPLGVRVMGM
jgi:hypothetical protein